MLRLSGYCPGNGRGLGEPVPELGSQEPFHPLLVRFRHKGPLPEPTLTLGALLRQDVAVVGTPAPVFEDRGARRYQVAFTIDGDPNP